jgi:hypothetical protein
MAMKSCIPFAEWATGKAELSMVDMVEGGYESVSDLTCR